LKWFESKLNNVKICRKLGVEVIDLNEKYPFMKGL
jgi:hypothetical protein